MSKWINPIAGQQCPIGWQIIIPDLGLITFGICLLNIFKHYNVSHCY